MIEIVRLAILHRQIMTFWYKNELRRVEPHLLGYDGDGDLTLSAWQLSGIRPGFRRFNLAKSTALEATAMHFVGSRPGYNRNDQTIFRMLCQL